MKAILAIDSGTTAAKAALVSPGGTILGLGRVPVRSRFGPGGRAEQDPEQIVSACRRAVREALDEAGRVDIVAAGITSQRSTFVIWDPATGRARAPAPTWQDTSAADLCQDLESQGGRVRRLTGLPLSPHYSAPKIARTLLRARVAGSRTGRREACFGSVATWLLWRLSRQRVHATDPTQAARTLLMNLGALRWDERLLSLFGVPRSILPQIRPGVGPFGTIVVGARTVPVTASLGDQQAALLAHTGLQTAGRGRAALVNYGTGAFVLVPAGPRRPSVPGLLTSVAWTTASRRRYLLEGTVNAAGAALDWLRREFGAPQGLRQIEALCRKARGDSLMLPAFWRLGSMWSDRHEGRLPSLFALSDPVDALAALTRATVESVAFMVAGILAAASRSIPGGIGSVTLAGPLSSLSWLTRWQAALCAPLRVAVSQDREATLVGIARAAAYGLGGEAASAAARWPARTTLVKPERGLVKEAAERRRSWTRLEGFARQLAGRAGAGG